VTRDVASHALVAGNPAQRLGWVCDCGQRLRDAASGRPAPASPEPGTILDCERCERRYAYVPDPERIVERPTTPAPVRPS
jgi:hypothetical protein